MNNATGTLTATKHLFILNPKSFWNKWKLDQVAAKIQAFSEKTGKENCLMHVSRFPREAISFINSYARTLSKDNTLRVYAVGGDGILFDCLNGIMELERVELAVIPYGHINDFVRGFGRNCKIHFRDLERQLRAPVIPMDVIRAGNNYALNYCSIGLESEAVRHSCQIRKKFEKGKLFSQWINRQLYNSNYIIGGILAAMDKRLLFQRYTVDIDGENLNGDYSTIAVFNGMYYGGGLSPIKNAIPTDGILDVLLTRSINTFLVYNLFPFYMTGRARLFPRIFASKQGSKISVSSEDPLLLCLDGEVFLDNNIKLELLPGALRFVNAAFKD